ncbi:ABC transporter permease [Enterococcus sp. DIV0756]|uniref:ABC transporter permease n=1 Tax=Enterococcus sp. DIV0756 TaxID=2774636 RepID=UPI003F268E36
MRTIFFSLLKKDLRMIISSKFLLLTLGSLVLYCCYIQLVYVNVDQKADPIFLYDPKNTLLEVSSDTNKVDSLDELEKQAMAQSGIGIDLTQEKPRLVFQTSGSKKGDQLKINYALAMLSPTKSSEVRVIGQYNSRMKKLREITSEFLFFELVAVGFLGVASTLFKEKQMGVIRVHGVMPMSRSLFIVSKLGLFLFIDLLFACLLTFLNLGLSPGISLLPAVLLQTGILSLIMALIGFICAIYLSDFKQFSLVYLVLAVFITTPVFLAGQTSIELQWINFHPLYHLFLAFKQAYFQNPTTGFVYYFSCIVTIFLLFFLARKVLSLEMLKEG